MTPTQIWVLVFFSCLLTVSVAFFLSWFPRFKHLSYGLACIALMASFVYLHAHTATELTAEQREHQARIETALFKASRGWLVEASDGLVYKVLSVDVQPLSHHNTLMRLFADNINEFVAMKFGNGSCLRCAGYFVRVVGPEDPAYAELAVRFARQ